MPKLPFFNSKSASAGRPDASSDRELRGQQLTVNKHTVIIEGRLAEGGFAIVYVARCVRTDRLYALKRQFVNDSKQLEACKREIHIIEKLHDHKHIVHYIDASVTPSPAGDGVYECMLLTKYYKRNVLQVMNDRLSLSRSLREEEILNIFCDMCEAVARLHHAQTPIIHRDLKVENILIDDDGSYVLCDFGSATNKVLSADKQSTSAIEEEINKYTTLAYRAPEMVDLYSCRPITTKSDIWALGVMLYKLCFFTLPFGESALAIQNGSFGIPDFPVYTESVIALLYYMLDPDMNTRPDIYQVAHVAFQLAKRRCGIGNLNNVKLLSHANLVQLKREREAVQSQQANVAPASQQPQQTLIRDTQSPSLAPLSTTVAPRQRPKGLAPTSAALGSGQTPWKQRSDQRVVESASNPDLGTYIAQQQKQHDLPPSSLTPSQPVYFATVAQLTKPSDELFFPEAESIQNPFLTPVLGGPDVMVQEEPLVELAPDQSQSLPPAGQIAVTEFRPPMHHRRNVSDTTAAMFADSNRKSAFKPYQAHTTDELFPSKTHSAHVSPFTAGGGLNAAPLVDTTDGNGSGDQSRSYSLSASDVSSDTLRKSSYLTDFAGWNPFQMVSGPTDIDDVAFGNDFDKLPRRGSASSTSNVKSRESLVMDDKDPFGAAPFDPLKKSPRQKERHIVASKEGKKAKRLEVPKQHRRSSMLEVDKVQSFLSDEEYGSFRHHQMPSDGGSSSGGERSPPPDDASKSVVGTTADVSTLTSLTNSLTKQLQTKYRKLVDTDDEGENRTLVYANEQADHHAEGTSSEGITNCAHSSVAHDDVDSIGNAHDLEERMLGTSTDDELSDATADSEGGGAAARARYAPDEFYGYEHFADDARRISRTSSHSTTATDGSKSSRSAASADRVRLDVEQQATATWNPYDNDLMVDRIGHRPLLDDDELQERHTLGSSLPKEGMELHMFNSLNRPPVSKMSLTDPTSPMSSNTVVFSPDRNQTPMQGIKEQTPDTDLQERRSSAKSESDVFHMAPLRNVQSPARFAGSHSPSPVLQQQAIAAQKISGILSPPRRATPSKLTGPIVATRNTDLFGCTPFGEMGSAVPTPLTAPAPPVLSSPSVIKKQHPPVAFSQSSQQHITRLAVNSSPSVPPPPLLQHAHMGAVDPHHHYHHAVAGAKMMDPFGAVPLKNVVSRPVHLQTTSTRSTSSQVSSPVRNVPQSPAVAEATRLRSSSSEDDLVEERRSRKLSKSSKSKVRKDREKEHDLGEVELVPGLSKGKKHYHRAKKEELNNADLAPAGFVNTSFRDEDLDGSFQRSVQAI